MSAGTSHVIALACKILELLNIDPRAAPLRLIPLPANNIPTNRAGKRLPFQWDQPGRSKGDVTVTPDNLFEDRYSEPTPYIQEACTHETPVFPADAGFRDRG